MKQFTRLQAVLFYQSGEWKDWTDEEIVKIQLFQDKLCLPFEKFRQSVESVLKRPVWTHEFATPKSLIDEYQRERPAPTFEEILALIPEEKRIIIQL